MNKRKCIKSVATIFTTTYIYIYEVLRKQDYTGVFQLSRGN
ncbi:hypothetical protein [Clostridium bornimense]|nr:hypothetical protein [Clostridium bornimense]